MSEPSSRHDRPSRQRARPKVLMPGTRLEEQEAIVVRAAAERLKLPITHYFRRAVVEQAYRDLPDPDDSSHRA